MNVPKAWMQILCLVMLFGQMQANIDSKEYFCGKKLVRTLTELCSIYNNPTFGRNRIRRQIVEECCRSQCSRRYLVQYYCQVAKSPIAKLLNGTPENASKVAHEKDSNNAPSDHSAPSPAEERNSLNRIKKMRRLQSARNMIHHNPVPPANIGHVEHSQKPFYVWRFSRMY
ncbi:uncharacterized protein LOC135126541 isoform X2 [Zophobas morio]